MSEDLQRARLFVNALTKRFAAEGMPLEEAELMLSEYCCVIDVNFSDGEGVMLEVSHRVPDAVRILDPDDYDLPDNEALDYLTMRAQGKSTNEAIGLIRARRPKDRSWWQRVNFRLKGRQ